MESELQNQGINADFWRKSKKKPLKSIENDRKSIENNRIRRILLLLRIILLLLASTLKPDKILDSRCMKIEKKS